jgi:deazaflavin-dependent oxidoreductase (nitroreductase family)
MSPLVRRIFWFLNKFFMVPMFRLGFGPFFGNPLSGYIMVLKTIGRKSGVVRYVPLNYAIYKGDVYCISGGRKTSDWYRNLHANPEIEVILPGGNIYARMDEISDPGEKGLIARQVLKNAGFAGFFEGYNPFTISDEDLKHKIADLPVLRFQPLGVGNGPSDMGGWAWIWSFVVTAILIVLLVR